MHAKISRSNDRYLYPVELARLTSHHYGTLYRNINALKTLDETLQIIRNKTVSGFVRRDISPSFEQVVEEKRRMLLLELRDAGLQIAPYVWTTRFTMDRPDKRVTDYASMKQKFLESFPDEPFVPWMDELFKAYPNYATPNKYWSERYIPSGDIKSELKVVLFFIGKYLDYGADDYIKQEYLGRQTPPPTSQSDIRNAFAYLGLPASATLKEVSSRFRKLQLKHHSGSDFIILVAF